MFPLPNASLILSGFDHGSLKTAAATLLNVPYAPP